MNCEKLDPWGVAELGLGSCSILEFLPFAARRLMDPGAKFNQQENREEEEPCTQ